jgi:hypothetical protein
MSSRAINSAELTGTSPHRFSRVLKREEPHPWLDLLRLASANSSHQTTLKGGSDETRKSPVRLKQMKMIGARCKRRAWCSRYHRRTRPDVSFLSPISKDVSAILSSIAAASQRHSSTHVPSSPLISTLNRSSSAHPVKAANKQTEHLKGSALTQKTAFPSRFFVSRTALFIIAVASPRKGRCKSQSKTVGTLDPPTSDGRYLAHADA